MTALADSSNRLSELIDGVFECIQRAHLHYKALMMRSPLAKIHGFKVLEPFLVFSSLGMAP